MVEARPVSMKAMFQSEMSVLCSRMVAASGAQGEIVGEGLVIVQEVVLDGGGAVTQAEHEVGVPEMRVVAHDVPQQWPVSDHVHRLGCACPTLAHPHAEPAAEEHDLHRSDHLQRGDGEDETAAPIAHIGQLFGDLRTQIPGQDET